MGLRRASDHMQRTIGLNTVLDPERLQQGSRTNQYEIELAQAVNISIDDRGLPSLRQGDLSFSSGSYHSVFCKGGSCFVVQEREADAAIMQIVSVDPVTLVGVRSSLTKGRRMTWDRTGLDTFYSNGVENGYIRSGVSVAWPVNTYQGAEVDMQFATVVPKADHIAFRPGGQLLIAVGSAIFANHEPFRFGLFNTRSANVASLASDVTMLASVKEGFFVSDGSKTSFFRQMEGWYNYKQEVVEEAPVLLGALAHDSVLLREVLGENSPGGAGRIWASTEGICLGADNGMFVNLTKEKINYPAGYAYGACLVKDYTVIHTAS